MRRLEACRSRLPFVPSTAQASFYELFTGPATQILNRWFEGDILKAMLATDAVIGSMAAPSDPGSAYVLLHHVMGEAAGARKMWMGT